MEREQPQTNLPERVPLDIELRGLRIRLVDHIKKDHVGYMRGRVNDNCHRCENITFAIRMLIAEIAELPKTEPNS